MRKTIGFIILTLIILVPCLAGCLTTQSGAGGSDKLEILSHESTLNEYGYIVVEGTAKNICSSTLSYAEVIAKFYNDAKELVGTSSASIKAVDPGEVWSFKVVYRGTNVEDITGYTVNVGLVW
ncbi:MAG: hypothetical protein IBV52_09630 [Candidatus Bathyarchaeota archaeon]